MALGAVPRLLRRPRLGGPRAQPAQPPLVPDGRSGELSFETYIEDVVAALERLGPTTVVVGHGMGGLLALKAAERGRSRPRPASRGAARATSRRRPLARVREVPDVYGRAVIGWATLPEKLQRDHRDLTLADVLRIQHMLGQKPHESGAARRQMLRRAGRPRARCRTSRGSSSAAGLDRQVPRVDRAPRRVARGEYEPFGAHSHYGLVLGEQSHQQVAETIRGVPGGIASEVAARRRVAVEFAGRLLYCRPAPGGPLATVLPVPHSSRGLGHRPLKAEITGSNPVCE